MSDIIWIASFPKSGNTWVRFMVADLVFAIHDDSRAMEQKIPDMHKDGGRVRLRKDRIWRGHTFAKTHYPLSKNMEDIAHKTIYVLRNPLDVLASIVNYYDIEEERKEDLVDEFVKTSTIESFTIWGYGDWFTHLDSWLESEKPRLLLTYEDMSRRPLETCNKIAEFLEIDATPEDLARVQTNSSFERLQDLERREVAGDVDGFFKRVHKTPFVHKGAIGAASEIFTADQVRRLEQAFGERIAQYGLK